MSVVGQVGERSSGMVYTVDGKRQRSGIRIESKGDCSCYMAPGITTRSRDADAVMNQVNEAAAAGAQSLSARLREGVDALAYGEVSITLAAQAAKVEGSLASLMHSRASWPVPQGEFAMSVPVVVGSALAFKSARMAL